MVDLPSFDKEGGFEMWLSAQPSEWAQVLAVRAALRVFPLVLPVLVDEPENVQRQDAVVRVFRGIFVAWTARTNPQRDMRSSAVSAANALLTSVGRGSDCVRAVMRAARAVGYPTTRAGADGMDAIEASITATDSLDDAAMEQMRTAILDDCRMLITNSSNVIWEPLWISDVLEGEHYKANLPIWVRTAFDQFANSEMASDSSWKLITDWYRAILPNSLNTKPRSLFGEITDIDIATQPDEFWEREPQIVMEAIAEIVKSTPHSIGPASYYNLIVSGIDGSWDGNSGTMLRGRYLEFTRDDIKAKFDPIEMAYDQIIMMPTILAYESQHERSARVVRLLDLHVSNPRKLEFWFEPDERFAPISFEEMKRLRPRLDIESAELHRTHWAIKDVNLFDVLPIIDDYNMEEAFEEAIENLEPQAPAAFRFEWSDEKIVAQAPGSFTPDSETAQDLLDDVRRKALSLAERLERSNAEKRVRDSIQGLIDVLAERVADLRPGLLRSRSRSIEADAGAYAEPGDERELFPDAVAALTDLSETLRDLQGCFPQLREIEAEIMALDIDPSQADEVKASLDQIVDVVSDHEDVVDQSAIYALQTMEGIASEDASPAVRQKRIAEYALVVRNFMSPLARFALNNAFLKAVTKATEDVWAKARPKIVDGVADGLGSMSRPATIIAIASLVHLLYGPAAAIAAAAAGFGKIDRLLKLVEKWLAKSADTTLEEDSGEDDVSEDR